MLDRAGPWPPHNSDPECILYYFSVLLTHITFFISDPIILFYLISILTKKILLTRRYLYGNHEGGFRFSVVEVKGKGA